MGKVEETKPIIAYPFQERKGSFSGQSEVSLASDSDHELFKGAGEAKEILFISRKRSKGAFVLVWVLNSFSFSIIHYVEIEGQVQQMEVRYIRNAYELELLRRTRKLCSEGLYVDLEAVSLEEYRRFERIVKRHLKDVFFKRKNKEFFFR